jgi:hypothetical protein
MERNKKGQKNSQKKKGCIVVKMVYCGKKNCSKCPHGPYRYNVVKVKGKQTWQYVGRAS